MLHGAPLFLGVKQQHLAEGRPCQCSSSWLSLPSEVLRLGEELKGPGQPGWGPVVAPGGERGELGGDLRKAVPPPSVSPHRQAHAAEDRVT